jgi:hypothetical protein
MAYFAKLDPQTNVVLEVHSVNNNEMLDENGVEQEQRGIDFLVAWSGGYQNWKQTSYNRNFRKNFAGIGHTYDPVRDAFISQKEYESWVLNESTCQWQAPVPRPTDGGPYAWDETTGQWVVPAADSLPV